MGRVRKGAVVGVLLLVGACSPHASRGAPSQWGRPTMFRTSTTVDFPVAAPRVRDDIAAVLDEMDLEIRWSNLTGVDGEYIFRSVRQEKMKITYQALYATTTRVEVYSATDETTLGQLVLGALERKLGVPGSYVGSTSDAAVEDVGAPGDAATTDSSPR